MSEMFKSFKIENLDLSNWDTSEVTKMREMFSASTVGKLKVSNWDFRNVTDMSDMFSESTVGELDASNWIFGGSASTYQYDYDSQYYYSTCSESADRSYRDYQGIFQRSKV
jgi:surface protein